MIHTLAGLKVVKEINSRAHLEKLHPAAFSFTCRANVAHIRQSKLDSGLAFQVNIPEILYGGISSLCSDLIPCLQQVVKEIISRAHLEELHPAAFSFGSMLLERGNNAVQVGYCRLHMNKLIERDRERERERRRERRETT